MSALPSTGISPALSNKWDTATRRLGDLLDTLIAIRMDIGHGANGVAASPALTPAQLQEVRAMLDSAVASAKEMFDSIHNSAPAGVLSSLPRDRSMISTRTAGGGQTLP
jgi:hypothetical protein